MTVTTTSNLPPATQAYYDKRFLLRAKEKLAWHQFGQKRDMPGGVGKTVYFCRYTPRAARTTALDETTTGGVIAGALTSEEVSAAVALYGDWVEISRLADLTSIDGPKNEKVDLLSDQAALSIDTLVKNAVGLYISRVRADGDADYSVSGTADSGSATTLVDNALTQADDFWNGGFLIITGGTNYGEVRQVSGFVAGTDTVTTAAFTKAIDSTSKYRLVVGTGIVSGDVITTANIRLAKRELKRNKAIRDANAYFTGLLDSDTDYDIFADTTFINAATYKDNVDSLYTGEIGKWLGVRFVETTIPYRESVAGAQSDTGAVFVVPIFGREAYGVIDLEGQPKKVYVKSPDQLGQPIPLYSTIGWEVGCGQKVLNGLFVCGIMCGTTA